MANIPEINIAPEVITQVGPFPITNAMVTFYAVCLIIIVFSIFVRRKAGIVPSRLQVVFELIYEFIWDKMMIAFNGNEKQARKFMPLLFTIFLILLVANQFTLIPFVESILTAGGDIKLFRTAASHYSLPIVYTILVLLLANVIAFAKHPLRHIGNFIKVKQFLKIRSIKELPMAFLDFFLGLLDIVGELAKLASLSTRLFGNLFAGSIIVAIIGGLTPFTQFIIPMPFILLGILSGLVQAFVFVMLSILFISGSIQAVEDQKEATIKAG